MMMTRLTAPLASALLATAAPVSAQGVPPAQWPAEVRAYHAERVQECRQFNGGRLSFNDANGLYVRAADFNGDGRPDYLVDHHGLRCSSAASLFCAAQGCDFILFASQPDGRYINAGGFTGEAELVVQNGRPVLRVDAGQGPRLWGWNGRALAILVAGAPGRAATPIPALSAAQPYGFVINLTFSPMALSALARQPESLVIRAFYNGWPIPARARFADPTEGLIDLGAETVTIPGRPGFYLVTGAPVNRARVPWVRAVEARVSVDNTPTPQRRTTNDYQRQDYLNCTMPPVRLPEARRAPVSIYCQLQREVRR
jgi:hypothetical protein